MRSWFDKLRRPTPLPRPVGPLARYRYVRLRWRVLFAVVDFLGALCLRLGGFVRRQSPRTPQAILLVQLDHLGDAILSTGLLRGLRSQYPNARIDVLASTANAEFFACLPEVDRVQVASVTRFGKVLAPVWLAAMVRWGWRLRRNRYDLAIDPRGDFPAALILWLCGAPVRLGWGSGGGGFLLTHEADFVWGRHEVLSRQTLLDQLGIDPPLDEPIWAPRFVPSETARAKAQQMLSSWRPIVVVHVGAGTDAKRWPARHWQELICRLIVDRNPLLVMVGTAAEGEPIGELPGVLDLCGRLSIDELGAFVERAQLFIGGDSAPAHLASAVGTRALVLFSGTNRAEQWRPWGGRVRVLKHLTSCSPCHRQQCPLADHPCLAGLQPSAVFAAACELLDTHLKTAQPDLAEVAL